MKLKEAFNTYAATKLNEPNLKKYFVEHESIKKIKGSNEICVISGLKGTGKTATYRDLTEFDRNVHIVIDISSDTYSLNLPNSNFRAINYSHEFEYEIAIEFLQRIINDHSITDGLDAELLKKAKKHVKSFIEDLKSLGGRVTGVSVLGCGLNLSDPDKKVLTGLKGRTNELEAIETLKNICDAGIKLRLVIDDPEEVFFSDNNLNPQLLGGLWLATAKLNLLSNNFRSFLLMKTHIHDFVLEKTPDLDKYPNSQISLCWDKPSLKLLIKNRLKYFLKVKASDFESVLWGTNTSQEEIEENYKYIFDNLRNGPRELITWLYLALEHNEKKSIYHLDNNSLKQTLNTLSKKAFIYFNSSHGEEFPDIGSVVQIVFEDIENKEFTKKELTKRIRELQGKNADFQSVNKKHSWIQSTVSKEYSEIFFRVGAINLIGEKEIFPYMCDYDTNNFDMCDKIKLTPIFRNYLLNY